MRINFHHLKIFMLHPHAYYKKICKDAVLKTLQGRCRSFLVLARFMKDVHEKNVDELS